MKVTTDKEDRSCRMYLVDVAYSKKMLKTVDDRQNRYGNIHGSFEKSLNLLFDQDTK